MSMQHRKTIVVGLDGVPIEMLRELADTGVMPAVRDILREGTLRPMSVSLPEISSVSWSSFMTGRNPGHHGIYGFIDINPATYELRFPDFRDLAAPTFFDELGRQGKRSVILNLPSTYPARPIPGVLVSGFVAPDLAKAVYPPLFYPVLKKMGYVVDVDSGKGKDQKREFLADLHYAMQVRREAAAYLWRKEAWDLFMFTVTETDRLHHFLFDAWRQADHPYHQEFLDFYRDVDQTIAALYQRALDLGDFDWIMLSDHGFVSLKVEIYLNPLLKRHRFFSLEERANPLALPLDDRCKAFALDPSRIYVHRQDKYKKGAVAPQDYEAVRRDLKELLENHEVDGQRAVERVFLKEELYDGPMIEYAPDLVVVAAPGFDIKAGMTKDVEAALTHFSGMHRFDNAFLFRRGEADDAHRACIYDVKDMVCAEPSGVLL